MIESFGARTPWRQSALKNLVLITEHPSFETVSYNLCQTFMRLYGEMNGVDCSNEQFATNRHPERCISIYLSVTESVCEYDYDSYGPNHVITRTLQDAVIFARSKGIAVHIIQPRAMRNITGYDIAASEQQLKELAEATGGLYIKKTVFDQPSIRDSFWQILTHKPYIQEFSLYRASSYLMGDIESERNIIGSLEPLKQVPTLVHTKPVPGAELYEWDFDGDHNPDAQTEGPTVENTFSDTGVFLGVTAFSGPTSESPAISRSFIPITSLRTNPLASDLIDTQSQHLSGLQFDAVQDGENIFVNWDTSGAYSDDALVVILDPKSGIIIQGAGYSDGQLIIERTVTDELVAYIVDSGVESERFSVLVEQDTESLVDSVGLNEGTKTVEQKEPNSFFAAVSDSPVEDTQSGDSESATTQYSPSGSTTEVLGDDVVNTNPQEVGNIDDARQLFSDLSPGPAEEEPEKENNTLKYLIGSGVAVIIAFLGGAVFYLARKDGAGLIE